MDGAPAADFRAAFRATPGLYLLLDPEFRIAEATETWLRQTDTVREQVLGRTLFDVLADNPNDPGATGQRELRESLARVLQLCRADALPVARYDIRRRDGGWERRYWTLFNTPVLNAAGQVAWIVLRVRDVTELMRLRHEGAERDELAREQQLLIDKLRAANEELANRERSLSESERRLAIALQAGRLGSWEMNLPDRTMVSSDLHKACFGREPGDPFTHDELREAIYPDDRLPRQKALDDALQHGADYDVEYRTIWPDGSVHWVQIRGQVTARWPDGSARRMVGVSLDITDQKRIEERLEARVAVRTRELAEANTRLTAAIAERDAAERALLQSQRLEAIGQLTGGVAHDFNNLLAAVIGNLEVLATKLTDNSVLRHVESALAAAWRGGRLTQQLLAYARRQRLVSTSVNANTLVVGMEGLLRHTLGGLMQVETELDPALWYASTDLTQLELVVLNLAINARDAMPNGGKLRIATRNVPAGDSVLPTELASGDYV
ncbi:MAG: PAS domain-containing protein, partial [Acetobacteraceae bacterium]